MNCFVSLDEEFYNPKEKYRKEYNKNKSYKENLKRQVIRNGGWFRNYFLIDEKYVGRYHSTLVPVKIPYLIKIYDSSHCDRFRFAKRQAKRIVRRNKSELYNGCSYKRLYDYAWEVY